MSFTKEKALDIIQKLFAQADSEKDLENFGAAELFEQKANKLLLDYGIPREEITKLQEAKTSTGFINEIGRTIIANPFLRINQKTNLRKLWFEELAKIIAEAYSCKLDVDLQSANVNFWGYDLDREIATFMFLKLAEQANELCAREMKLAKSQVGKPSGFDFKSQKIVSYPSQWMEDDIFVDSFHSGFREEIAKSMLKHKKEDEEKLKAIETYFEQNKDQASWRYYYSYRQQNIYQSPINESAKSIGAICGFNISRKASKTPSALTVKNSVIEEKDSVVIVLDRSGSMSWDKLEQAKLGAIEYAKTAIEKGYNIGAIAFDSNIMTLFRCQKMNIEKLQLRLAEIGAGTSTNLTDALKAAQAMLSLGRKSKKVILVITDGMPDDENSALRVANDAKRLGIEIQVIGTYDVNKEFIDKLCSRSGLGILCENNRLALTVGSMAMNL